jgi:hypothetical protein
MEIQVSDNLGGFDEIALWAAAGLIFAGLALRRQRPLQL